MTILPELDTLTVVAYNTRRYDVPTATEPQFFSIGIAASKLGVSASTVRDWEKQGLVSPIRVAGFNKRIYRESDIEAVKAARSATQREKASDLAG